MGQSYHLTIISVSEIHWKPRGIHLLPGHDTPNLYVAIDIDGKRVHKTNPSRKQVAMWNQICSLSVDSPSSVVALQIIHKSTFSNHCLAKKEIEISQLLETDEGQKDLSVVLDYMEKDAMDMPGPTIVVRMTSISHVQAAKVALANATQDIGTLKSPSTSAALEKIMDIGADGGDLLSGLNTVLSRLKIVIAIGAEVSKIHPYSNVAYTVLFSVYQAVEKQKETDKSVGRLVQTMADVFGFADEVKSAVSEKIKRFEKTVYALVKQTEECALFIREYTGHGFSE
ncbi:hypothetical protein BDP27DRAFT_899505 [Rhodocollybia butyracea]|uniref:C2 domain-containing protein n=1 Tax=Rhodocollybia butyracea TaxID=206335 RepID=A0A9P5PQI0_9AGAR|nr:hypothetical protein BDP27DRAFT_899505 [Rhodocollybia butyracea]